MKQIPFYPLYKLIQVVLANGGLSNRGSLHIFIWLIKTIVLEPFRWIELFFYERKVNNHQIELPPIFILGHYRSGTTYIQRLLMQDSRLGYMSLFQSILPEVSLAFEGVFTWIGKIIVHLFNIKNSFHRIPFVWDFPGEDDVGMTALISSRGAQWGMLFPNRMEYYSKKYMLFENTSENEKQQWQIEYMYLLKKISLRNKGKRLVLKSPPNTARIQVLLELFPDARFIFIHRDPFEVYSSTKRLLNIIMNKYVLGGFDLSEIPQKIINNYSLLMESYLAQRSMVIHNRLIEIAYQDLVNEPIPTMKRIYNQIAINDFDICKTKVEAFAEKQQNYARLEHLLDTEEQMKVSKYWCRYFEEWNYPRFT